MDHADPSAAEHWRGCYGRHAHNVGAELRAMVNVDLELTLTTAPRFARAAGRNIGGEGRCQRRP